MKIRSTKNRPGRLLLFVLILGLLGAIAQPHPQAQSNQQSRSITSARVHRHENSGLTSEAQESGGGYVIVNSKDGVACRQMTELEAEQLQVEEPRTQLRVISDNRLNAQQQQGLKITLRGTSQLEQFPEAKQAFLRAAAKWQSIIQSPITVIIDVDFGPTIFGTPFPSPSIIGATDPQVVGDTDFVREVRNDLLAQSTNARQTEILTALPQNTLPTDLGPTSTIFSPTSIFRALGQIPATANPDAELSSFGPPPSIGFNSNFTFDFDASDGIDFDKTDFEATAIHEIGHALGFTSRVGGKELSPSAALTLSVWDFFRFRPGGLATNSIATGSRVHLAGGDHVYFIGDAELPLSTSTNSGTAGDGRQSSHWKDNALIGTYTGVMDPTLASGERFVITAADLTALNYFGYKINPATTIAELLSVDDGSREDALTLTNAIVVNRYSPARYPAQLEAVRVQIPPTTNGSSPVGQQLRIVAFVDANRTGQPPANPSLIVDRTITVPDIPAGTRIIETVLPSPPTINAGDLYVGIQSASASILIAGDRTGRQQNRSFVSTNNGTSFQPLQNAGNAPLNFISRIVLTESFSATASPALALLSPSAMPPGSSAFSLVVQGSNFQSDSVVRWNGADRPTTLVNGTQLQAQIPASDVATAGTASVTVRSSVGESGALPFNITANRPLPVVSQISPNTQAVGASTPLNLSVFGTDFTPQSVIRYNGNDRTTTVVSSTQLTTSLPPADFTASGNNQVTVFTPGPGGGTSNGATLSVVSCTQALSVTSHTIVSGGTAMTGTTLTTPAPCGWSATSNAPWITVLNPAGGAGAGKFVINYRVDPNADANLRTGTLTIAGQTVTVRQLGRASTVSAASFAAALTANSIGAIFGAGLAKSTVSATTQPLPTNLNGTAVTVIDANGTSRAAGLFFVSAGQINFLIPNGTANGTASIRVLVDGTFFADGPATISTVAPSLFASNASGKGLAAAVLLRVKADGTQSFEPVARFDTATSAFVPVPIDFGAATDRLFLLLYGSGVRGRTALSAVSVSVGGTNAEVSYAGPQNDFAGLDQINVELSRSLIGRGEVTINCTVDGKAANALTVTIK